jgi:hypothetical protein
MPLNRFDMDMIAIQGCSTPGCTHEHDGTIFIHQDCHPDALIIANKREDGTVTDLACLECDERFLSVATKEWTEWGCKVCGHEPLFYASYSKDTGEVRLECAVCEEWAKVNPAYIKPRFRVVVA